MLERIDKKVQVGIIGAAVVIGAGFGGIAVKKYFEEKDCFQPKTRKELEENQITIAGEQNTRLCTIKEKNGVKKYIYIPTKDMDERYIPNPKSK